MKLHDLFAQVLDVPQDILNDASSPETVAAWDSMATINLVSAMEEAYSVIFTTAEIRALKTLGDARKCLRAKKVSDHLL